MTLFIFSAAMIWAFVERLAGTAGLEPVQGEGGFYAAPPEFMRALRTLCDRSNVIGSRMVERQQQMKARDDVTPMGDVRGLGAMVAFVLVTERGGNEPNPAAVPSFTAKALEHGVILLACGYWRNSVRILAPPTIDEAQLEEGLDIIERCLVEIAT